MPEVAMSWAKSFKLSCTILASLSIEPELSITQMMSTGVSRTSACTPTPAQALLPQSTLTFSLALASAFTSGQGVGHSSMKRGNSGRSKYQPPALHAAAPATRIRSLGMVAPDLVRPILTCSGLSASPGGGAGMGILQDTPVDCV